MFLDEGNVIDVFLRQYGKHDCLGGVCVWKSWSLCYLGLEFTMAEHPTIGWSFLLRKEQSLLLHEIIMFSTFFQVSGADLFPLQKKKDGSRSNTMHSSLKSQLFWEGEKDILFERVTYQHLDKWNVGSPSYSRLWINLWRKEAKSVLFF